MCHHKRCYCRRANAMQRHYHKSTTDAQTRANMNPPRCHHQRVSANTVLHSKEAQQMANAGWRHCRKGAQTRATASPVGHCESHHMKTSCPLGRESFGIQKGGCQRGKSSIRNGPSRPRTLYQASLPTRKTLAVQSQVSQCTTTSNQPCTWYLSSIIPSHHQEVHAPFVFEAR